LTPEETLYALPPDRFIAARDEAVAEARAAGDREGAARLAKLRRPTVAAWLVNLLALHRPEQLGELLDLASALRDAQHRLRGDELRALSNRRRQAIARLVGQVRGLAVEAGRPARETLPLAEVEATLVAALADDEVAEAVRAGRLTKATEYAGFGEVPAGPAEDGGKPRLRVIDGGGGDRAPADRKAARGAGARDTTARDTTARDTAARDGRDAEAREERRAAQAAAQAARAEERRRAEATLREAAAEQERAVRELRDLAAQLDALKERHAAAEVALREAKLRHRTAQRAVARLS
jgi:hypothetical protein